MAEEELHRRIRKLERHNRLLEQRLTRAERERAILEAKHRGKESLLTKVVADLNHARDAARRAGELLERRVQSRVAAIERQSEELREDRDQALRASRAKSSFIANMSHELRTPLNSIIGYSELIKEEVEDAGHAAPPAESLGDVERIHQSAHHLLALINDILDLSKIEAGQSELYLETIDLNDFVHEIVGTLTPLARRNNNEFTRRAPEDCGRFVGDRTKLRQIVYNLGSNAAKFTKGGEVELHIQRHPAALELAVRDTGIGIAPDKFDRLFSSFSQVEDSTTRDYGGTGLGLALTHKLCMLMGGDITVESRPGVGSTFSVFLPHSPPKPMVFREAPDDARGWSGARRESGQAALVLDDDRRAHDQLRAPLRRLGLQLHSVTEIARDHAEIVARARSLRPALIIIDPLASRFTDGAGVRCCADPGWELLAALQREPALSSTSFVILTALSPTCHKGQLGAAALLKKPVAPPLLLDVVQDRVRADSAHA